MKTNDKQFRFIGEMIGGVIATVVMETTRTVYRSYLEPKILKEIDKTQEKHKHPIGFRMES